MYMYTQGHSRIVSAGVYLPDERISSKSLLEQIDSQKRFDIPHDWLDRVMGVHERRTSPDNMFPSDMAAEAAKEAMQRSSIDPAQIDAIIYAGVDRDYLLEPATAHVVQDKIGAYNAVAFDVTNACHGFMNGIHLMDALIATGQARRGLVVTGEQGTRYIRKAIEALTQTNDRQMFLKLVGGLTLGDAGAALIMGPKLAPDNGFMGFMLQSQGQYSQLCTCGKRGGESPLETDMTHIVEQNRRLHSAMYKAFMDKLKWRSDQITRFVHHQVGKNVFKHHAQYTGIPHALMTNTVGKLGNLVTATIPVNIYNLIKDQQVNKGDRVFLSGSGSGLAISQAALIWDAA